MRILPVLLLVIVGFAGCNDEPAPDEPPAPPEVDQVIDDRATHPDMPGMYVWGNLVECGDGAHCYDVYARNEGSRTYYYSGCIPPWQYGIHDEDGQTITSHRENQGIPGCAFSNPIDPQPIPPGDYIGQRICWDERTGNGDPVPPGTYDWTVRVTIYKNNSDPYEPKQIEIATTVEVVEGPQPSCA